MVLNSDQVINGLAVLFSFFVGYQYALKRNSLNKKVDNNRNENITLAKDSPGKIFKGLNNRYKMVLVVRNDLKMGRGKIGAQCAHAAVGAYEEAMERTPQILREWEDNGSAKIVVRVESEAELLAVKRQAKIHNLNNYLVTDAGRTQIEPNTKTVLAIGPANEKFIDVVTGHLKLL